MDKADTAAGIIRSSPDAVSLQLLRSGVPRKGKMLWRLLRSRPGRGARGSSDAEHIDGSPMRSAEEEAGVRTPQRRSAAEIQAMADAAAAEGGGVGAGGAATASEVPGVRAGGAAAARGAGGALGSPGPSTAPKADIRTPPRRGSSFLGLTSPLRSPFTSPSRRAPPPPSDPLWHPPPSTTPPPGVYAAADDGGGRSGGKRKRRKPARPPPPASPPAPPTAVRCTQARAVPLRPPPPLSRLDLLTPLPVLALGAVQTIRRDSRSLVQHTPAEAYAAMAGAS